MVHVTILILLRTVTTVHVLSVPMELTVNLIIDLVMLILVEIMVRIFCIMYYYNIYKNICLFSGVCNATNTTFIYTCSPGWYGSQCQTKVNYCYSGRHCEITAAKIVVYQTTAKSLVYIAIVAILCVTIFIIVMDILKYCFGIDPTHKKPEKNKRKNLSRKPKPFVIQRFVYINPSTQISPDKMNSIKKATPN